MRQAQYAIKEVLDEAVDDNGLKINLNLCPNFDDDQEIEDGPFTMSALHSAEKMTDGSETFSASSKAKSQSFKGKKKKKNRKFTKQDSKLIDRINGSRGYSPLNKVATTKS